MYVGKVIIIVDVYTNRITERVQSASILLHLQRFSRLESGIFGGSLDEFFRKPNEMMKYNIYIQLWL